MSKMDHFIKGGKSSRHPQNCTPDSSGIACPLCSIKHIPVRGSLSNGIYAFTCENCGHFVKFKAIEDVKSSITFTINGKEYTVGNEWALSTTLNTFMRESGVSVGTKVCCYEGGCGTCLVSVELLEPVTHTKMAYSVNSCCLELYACDGIAITTIEGLGNPRTKLHPVQERLSKYNGAQCGFCSPGQVMNMYALLQKNTKPTMQQIEDEFDATICRCTGYRSILDAMKSFAIDASPSLSGGTIDIENLDGNLCKKTGKSCTGHCSKDKETNHGSSDCENQVSRPIHLVNGHAQWFKPTSMAQLKNLLYQYKDQNYRLVFGNTGFGVYKEISTSLYDILIDLRGILEMYGINFGKEVTLGANLSITNLIDLFDNAQSIPYGADFVRHLKQVAMNGIRNMACWAGNLMLKHKHPEFASNIFTMLETVSAKVSIVDINCNRTYCLEDFLHLDMRGRFISAMTLPIFESKDIHIRTMRTALRLQACHSYIISGFMFDLLSTQNYLVKSKPSIVIQGISSQFIHATKTEDYLTNKQLGDPAVLKMALSTLSSEMVPESYPLDPDPTYRKILALAMFYKFALQACKDKVDPHYLSGGLDLERSLITGTQDYGTDASEYPVSKPVGKLTEDYLTTGSVKYIMDLPKVPEQLEAAVVISTQGNATISQIDPSEALKLSGVVACLTHKDIPGVNNWRPSGIFTATEELLCSGTVHFAGQPIAVVVADTAVNAQSAASMVKITYTDVKTPVVDLKDAIKKKMFFPNPPDPVVVGDAKGAISTAPHKISGSIGCGDQYHFHLENQSSLCTPTDVGGMKVVASSQWLDGVLETVAQVLGLAQSDVTVEAQRLGGGFGGKITQNFLVSGLCALASYVLNRPVRLHLDIHTNMKMLGKRTPYIANYEIGFDDSGKLQGIKLDMYADVGWLLSSSEAMIFVRSWFDNAYYCPNWLWVPIPVKTNKPVNTECRSPGSLPAMFIMESIMEHVAKSLGKDQLEVRKENLYVKGQTTPRGMVLEYCTIRAVVAQLEADIKLAERKQHVQAFNKANRWKKRGLSVMPNKFGVAWATAQYNCHVMVYHGDGSVAIGHGGIDMGQGINTKVVQVCAFELCIPMDKIRVKTSSTTINTNSITSGGAITSELCCKGVIECCNILKRRMAPVKARLTNPSWLDIVHKCYQEMVDLTASYMTHPVDKSSFHYNCYSAACVEAELDILTGQYQLRQMDMLYDCGQSMNPELDIGQAEGGFVFGLGYFLTEEMKYDPKTGEAANASTWEYKPPMAKDLPMKFNFKFQRNAPNPLGVLRSKAVGEPPVTMSAAALFAIKHAVEAARAEIEKDTFFPLSAPATLQKVHGLCMNDVATFTYKK